MSQENLTEKQKLFADIYLGDPELNATKAYLSAYPKSSVKAAEVGGHRLLRNTKIASYIAKEMKARSSRLQVDSDYVLQRLVEIDQMDAIDILEDDGSIKPISEWPKVWRTYLSGIDIAEITEDGVNIGMLKKIKWPDKVKNLELIGKHVSVSAFKEKVEISGDKKNPLEILVSQISGKTLNPGDDLDI
jgi:phage terminase small subunit